MRNLKIPAQSAKKQRQIPQIILAKSPSIIVLGNNMSQRADRLEGHRLACPKYPSRKTLNHSQTPPR
jgi:hypothetical protein